MGSNCSNSTFSFTSLLLSLIMIITPISDARTTLTPGRNRFNSLYIISQLSDKDRADICEKFDLKDIVRPVTIQLVYLTFENFDSLSADRNPYIPTIQCDSKQTGTIRSYITVAITSVGTPFFKLQELNNTENGIYTKFVSKKAISPHQNNLENVENNVIEYFKSESYRETAKRFFQKVASSTEWEQLCNTLRKGSNMAETEIPREIYNAEFEKSKLNFQNVTFYENQDAVEIPAFPCPVASGFDENFSAAFFTDDIVFKVYNSQSQFVTDYDLTFFN